MSKRNAKRNATFPRIRYFIVCEEAQLDQENNKLSCIGVFEEIVIGTFPAKLKLDLVLGVDRVPRGREFEVSYEIQEPNGSRRRSPTMTLPADVNDPSPVFITRATLTFGEPGLYRLGVLFDEQLQDTYDLWFYGGQELEADAEAELMDIGTGGGVS